MRVERQWTMVPPSTESSFTGPCPNNRDTAWAASSRSLKYSYIYTTRPVLDCVCEATLVQKAHKRCSGGRISSHSALKPAFSARMGARTSSGNMSLSPTEAAAIAEGTGGALHGRPTWCGV